MNTDMKDGKTCETACKPHCCKKALCVLVLVLAFIAGGIYAQPSKLHVERSTIIKASPSAIFAQVNTLKNWETWSPFVKMDPESTATYAGPKSGKDAAMSWEGKKTGKGTMTVINSRQNEWIEFRLDFEKPMKGTDTANFRFDPVEGGTRVTWSMDGHKNFLMKLMGLIMNCDKMMGKAFEDGLASLKDLAEKK